MKLQPSLDEFAKSNSCLGSKGSLSVLVTLTRLARSKDFPLQHDDFLTSGGGQVSGLGGAVIKKILEDHGITRILSSEGGRTSRGSVGLMRAYTNLLNQLQAAGVELEEVESWWVAKVNDFFQSKPLKLKLDQSRSLASVFGDLLASAEKKQKQNSGTMYVGAVMQHLVGAKLEVILGVDGITHNGFSVADQQTARSGDFVLSDVVVHVTVTPTEALLAKCAENLSAGCRPIIVTVGLGVQGAVSLATAQAIEERIEVWDICQFLAANLHEWSKFGETPPRGSVENLISIYNSIVDVHETDPSLRVELI